MMSDKIVCAICNSEFSKRKCLYAHSRKIHKVELLTSKVPNLKCDQCLRLFSCKYTLQRHIRNTHIQKGDHTYERLSIHTSRILCPEDSCTQRLYNYASLRKHLVSDHSIAVESENLEFSSFEDFHMWKLQTEQQTISQYVLDTATKQLASHYQKQYYNCHRSYIHTPKGKNIRTLKSTGSNKIGKACPSRMEVLIIGPDNLKVSFWKTHCGHRMELGHLFLNKQTRLELAGKLAAGVSLKHILDEIRDNKDNQLESNTRLGLLEGKDLHNILRDYNIHYATKRHSDDAVSVKLWVDEMLALNEECPVLYYKGQDEDDDSTLLDKKDFALIIMTVFQSEQLIKFGSSKICIDGTHGTNAYDIQLYTIMIVNEFGSGCPVAYCFSNRCDELIFSLFFNKLKLKVGIINANVFMSDDCPAFYNAWSAVMGHASHKLLCSWHIDKNWRLNLNKIHGQEKKIFVYKSLRVLLQILSVEEFNVCMNSLLEKLNADEDTKAFGEYFQNYYAYRPQAWAYSYRIGLGINTNMYLESYHKILKHVYLEGKKVKRLDKSIDAVMKIARVSIFKRIIQLNKNTPSEKMQRINASHTKSLNMLSEITTLTESKEWLVASSSTVAQYHVTYVQETCAVSCPLCSICNICIHTFKCSCTDNLIKGNICKHIHACAQKTYGYINNVMIDNNTVNCTADCESESLFNMCKRNTDVQMPPNNVIIKKVELLLGLATTTSFSKENSKLIEKYLDKAISAMNKENIVNNQNSIMLETIESVNTNQKISKQNRLYSVKKKRTKGQNICNPSFSETNIIKESLVRNSDIVHVHTEFDHTYGKATL